MFALLLGCSSLLTISIEETAITTVEAGTVLEELLGDLGFEDFVTMDLTASEALQNQGVEPGDISSSALTLLELSVIEPDNGDLSFLENMVISVESPDVTSALVASQDTFPVGVGTVLFDLEELDLTPYIVSQSLSLTTEVSASRPEEETVIQARFIVDVTATVQGVKNQVD
jgi:hypothetical protein